MNLKIAMLGATGAVGGEALNALVNRASGIHNIILLGRRSVENLLVPHVKQHRVDVTDPSTYIGFLSNVDVAICTLGVGQPSKVSPADFLKIDKTAVLDFGKACKSAGVSHFQLLSSVGINAKSSNYFLRTKGELVEEL